MHRAPTLAKLRRLRGVAGLVVLGLLCRALIPVGFMPAAWGAGGPVVVCHGGLAGEFFRRLDALAAHGRHGGHGGHGGHGTLDGHAGHGAHGDHGLPVGHADPAADHEGWEHCPFGAAFGIALLAGDVAPDLPDPEDALGVAEPSLPVSYRSVSSYRARAPPSSAIHS